MYWLFVNFSVSNSVMEFEILADKVEKWIVLFQNIIHDGHSHEYISVDHHVWNFIWRCVYELESRYQPYCCDLKSKHGLDSTDRFILGARNPHTFKYDPKIKQWLLEIIESIPIPTNPFFFTLQCRGDGDDKTLTIIQVCSKSKNDVQNYVCFMRCLFPSSFQSTSIVTSIPNKTARRHNVWYRQQTQQNIRYHCTWTMSPETYQRSLELFPRWPIVVQSTCFSDEERFEIMSAYMIPDLVKICIAYLPTHHDYDHIRELPQKH